MDGLPSPELLDVLFKILERIGIPTGLLLVFTWVFIKVIRQRVNGGSSEDSHRTHDAQLKALAERVLRLEQFHDDFLMLKARLSPILTVMDSRLAEMFHREHDPYQLDRLIEKYTADPTELKSSLTDAELHAMTQAFYRWYRHVRKDGPEPNPSEELALTLKLALLDGLREARLVARRQAEVSADRESLLQALMAPEEVIAPGKTSWWQRWKKSLFGFNC
jgi:hypothetical protein